MSDAAPRSLREEKRLVDAAVQSKLARYRGARVDLGRRGRAFTREHPIATFAAAGAAAFVAIKVRGRVPLRLATTAIMRIF